MTRPRVARTEDGGYLWWGTAPMATLATRPATEDDIKSAMRWIMKQRKEDNKKVVKK